MTASMSCIGYVIFIYISLTYGYCPDDKELQSHQCKCNLINNYIQCSSLPNQCQTCYRYKSIFFDEKVHFIPIEAFRFYNFFNKTKRNLFQIRFAHINNLSINSFSMINISQERILEIKIFQYSSSIIPKRIFENIIIQTKAKLNIEIFNITQSKLIFEQYTFDGIKLNYQSQFRLSIFYAKDTIQFQSNAGSILLPSYSYMEIYISNFIQILLNQQTFAHITQEQSSEFILNFDHFQTAIVYHKSFYNIHQFEQSRFHFSLSNFQNLIIEQTLFDTINQLQSFLIVTIYNLTNDLCLLKKTFNQIKQNFNSTFQFEINFGQNILFTSESFHNIKQNLQSNLMINIRNSLDIYFSQYSLKNFQQENQSLIDISIKYGQNLIFENYAIYHSNILKIAFLYSKGTLQMATNAFSQINQNTGGILLFQLINSTDFYFRFNQSISFEFIEILDRSLTSNDFCRISNIPSHIPIKLSSDSPCSCTIYYLYRFHHHNLDQTILNQLTPSCYSNMTFNEIESAENECLFPNKISHCQQMDGEIQITIPQGICQKDIRSNQITNNSTISSFIFFLILLACFIFLITCIYILFLNYQQSLTRNFLPKYFRQRSKRTLIVQYNSTTQNIENNLL